MRQPGQSLAFMEETLVLCVVVEEEPAVAVWILKDYYHLSAVRCYHFWVGAISQWFDFEDVVIFYLCDPGHSPIVPAEEYLIVSDEQAFDLGYLIDVHIEYLEDGCWGEIFCFKQI